MMLCMFLEIAPCCLRDAALLRTLVNHELYFVLALFYYCSLFYTLPVDVYIINMTTCRAPFPDARPAPLPAFCLCLFLVLLSLLLLFTLNFSKRKCGACNISSPSLLIIFLIVVVFFVVIYLFVDAADFKIEDPGAAHVRPRSWCLWAIQDYLLSS